MWKVGLDICPMISTTAELLQLQDNRHPLTDLIATLMTFNKPKENAEELHRIKCTFFFHFTQKQFLIYYCILVSETSSGSTTPSAPRDIASGQGRWLATLAQTLLDTDFNGPIWTRNHNTGVNHHKQAARHTHSYRRLYIKGSPRRCQHLFLGWDKSVPTEASSRAAMYPQKARPAFYSCLSHVPEKQDPSSLP